jgi:hypothetical protein
MVTASRRRRWSIRRAQVLLRACSYRAIRLTPGSIVSTRRHVAARPRRGRYPGGAKLSGGAQPCRCGDGCRARWSAWRLLVTCCCSTRTSVAMDRGRFWRLSGRPALRDRPLCRPERTLDALTVARRSDWPTATNARTNANAIGSGARRRAIQQSARQGRGATKTVLWSPGLILSPEPEPLRSKPRGLCHEDADLSDRWDFS